MATSAQLQHEVWWGLESLPPALTVLSAGIRAAFGLPANAVGSKGDTAHLDGYHRSAAWVHNSRYCTNRTYSVTETPGNRAPGDANWICAVDATIPHAQLLAACQRLDTGVRAGLLEKVTEWYGNDDGDNRVDGYNNVRNVVASSDSSHLWHLHMSFDRGRANEDHADVLAVLAGTPTHGAVDRMTTMWLITDGQADYWWDGTGYRRVKSLADEAYMYLGLWGGHGPTNPDGPLKVDVRAGSINLYTAPYLTPITTLALSNVAGLGIDYDAATGGPPGPAGATGPGGSPGEPGKPGPAGTPGADGIGAGDPVHIVGTVVADDKP